MTNSRLPHICLTCIVILLLQGCAAMVITGSVAGAAVAIDRRTAGTVVEDQSIELKVTQALRADAEINKYSHWNVISYNTIVLVTGETPNEELHGRIIDIVRSTPKVKQIHDEITIAGPSAIMSRSSDTVITSKVKSKLLANRNVKGLHIKVVTEKGVVYLMGLLNRAEADIATNIARQTGGVQKVVKLFQYID